ncbi:MAG: DedA family protein [Patescibacteria group bacterium]
MELSPYLLELVTTYGYLAVFLGSLIEGDALLLVASFLAYLGKLDLPIVMLAAFLGTWLSDVIWFLLGRYSTSKFLERWSWLHTLSQHSISMVGKRPRLMAVSVRFMYGLRMVIPLSLGRTSMSTSSFMIYNALGVLIWVGVFSALGYFFASVTESIFGRMKHLDIILPIIIVGTMLVFIYASHIIEYALRLYPKNRKVTD